MLIKTDSQHYTDIANSVREITGNILYEGYFTTFEEVDASDITRNKYCFYGLFDGVDKAEGDIFNITIGNMIYHCPVKKFHKFEWLYVGNSSIWWLPYAEKMCEGTDYTVESYISNIIQLDLTEIDTGEPFLIIFDGLSYLYTKEPKPVSATTPSLVIKKLGVSGYNNKTMKPSEIVTQMNRYIPDGGVSFNSFDQNGLVTSATVYGNTIKGLACKEKLTSLNIQGKPTTIDKHAFEKTGLTSFVVPNSVTRIESHAFYFSKLTSITFHDNISYIGDDAFCGCGLTSLDIPKGISTIEMSTFSYNEITTLVIPDNIKKIDFQAFSNCKYLETVTFKGTPNSISSSTFTDCSRLTAINVPWSEGDVAYAPWGATNATINYNYIE